MWLAKYFCSVLCETGSPQGGAVEDVEADSTVMPGAGMPRAVPCHDARGCRLNGQRGTQ
jgi:hypothetical protein